MKPPSKIELPDFDAGPQMKVRRAAVFGRRSHRPMCQIYKEASVETKLGELVGRREGERGRSDQQDGYSLLEGACIASVVGGGPKTHMAYLPVPT